MSWTLVKLSEVCTLINGRAYNRDELLSLGKYEVLRVGNFFSNRNWYYSDLELPEDKYCESGDLLYAWSASFGPRIWEGGKVIYHYHIWKIVIDENIVDKKYLFHALKYDVESIKREQGTGSTMLHVTKSAMEDRLIPLPPLPEQKRIAAILDKADAICGKRQQAIQLAADFLRAVFLGMFGDPVTNPKGWEVDCLRNVGTFKNGLNYGKEEIGTSVHFLGVGDFKSLDRIDGVSTLSDIHLNTLPSEGYLLKDGDLVFVRSNGNKDLVGRCITVYPGDEKLTFSGFCIRFRVSNERLCAEYLKYLFRMPSVKNKMLRGGQGANIQNINQEMLSEIAIPIPSIDLQNEFLEIVGAFKSFLTQGNISLDNIQNLLRTISLKGFSGQL